MSRTLLVAAVSARLRSRRAERRSRLALERELAGFAAARERNDLEVLAAEQPAAGSGEISAILSRQAGQRLFCVG